jgi:flagellar protein FliO/FliZ
MQLLSALNMTPGTPVEHPSGQGTAVLGGAGLDVGQQLVQVLGSLGVVLALVLALAWLAKRLSRTRTAQTRGLRLIGGISLGAKERIVLVQVGDQQLLVGVAPGCLQTLHVLQQPLAENAGKTPDFPERMSEILAKRQGRGN